MKHLGILLIALFSNIAHAFEVKQITDESVPFLYESRAQIPASIEKLASMVSAEYRNAQDEFSKLELLEKAKPVVNQKLKNAASTNNYMLRIGTNLGQYDFKNNFFPSGFSSSTFVPFDRGYGVTFVNAIKLERIPIPLEEAKKLSKQLQKSRHITAVIYITIQGAEEQKLTWRHQKALVTKIDKVEYITQNGHTIYTETL